MIFTASSPQYANKIIDQIDKDGTIFSSRLFKQHCYPTKKGLHIKDLRILARDPRDVVLVDNAAYSYGFQLFNGVPIIPFYGDPNDRELLVLQNYLDYLKDKDDVRIANKKHFKYHLYKDGVKINDLKKKLFK